MTTTKKRPSRCVLLVLSIVGVALINGMAALLGAYVMTTDQFLISSFIAAWCGDEVTT